MSKSDVFHIGLTKKDLKGVEIAIVPGDIESVEKIEAVMDKWVKLVYKCELTSWRGELDGKVVIVWSNGMGGSCNWFAVFYIY